MNDVIAAVVSVCVSFPDPAKCIVQLSACYVAQVQSENQHADGDGSKRGVKLEDCVGSAQNLLSHKKVKVGNKGRE